MPILSVELNKQFKSLTAGTKFKLDGDLIVISGVNGSGKSHLADVLKGNLRENAQTFISRNLELDDVAIPAGNVLIRFFGDTMNTRETQSSNSSNLTNDKNQIWNSYIATKLDPTHLSNIGFLHSAAESKEFLVQTFGVELFQSGIQHENFDEV